MDGYQNKKRKIAETRKNHATSRYREIYSNQIERVDSDSSLLIMTHKQSGLHRQKLSRSEALQVCFRTAIRLEITVSL
jgi:hypothetical protein